MGVIRASLGAIISFLFGVILFVIGLLVSATEDEV